MSPTRRILARYLPAAALAVGTFAPVAVSAAELSPSATSATTDGEVLPETAAPVEEPPPPPPPPPPAPVAAVAPAVTSAPSQPAEEPAELPDHEQMVGRVGVSWFGMSNVPIAVGSPMGTSSEPAVDAGTSTFVPAPCIGIRYWFSQLAGLDVGVGFSLSTGSLATTSSAADKQTVLAFMYHLGVPISLVHGQHVSLQITPEVTVAHAHSEVEPMAQLDPPPNATLSGFRMDVGARVGAEIQFGFIGVPELALEGSLGLYGTYQATSISVGDARASENNLLIATGEYQSPWDIFTQHVRARYYF